jgi:hypothetical protein
MTAEPIDGPGQGAPIEEWQSLSEIEAGTPGAGAHTPLHFPLKAWWAILKRLYVMNDFHNLPLLSAGVAFFAFLAFVPLIAVIVLLYGLVGDPDTVTASIEQISGILPDADRQYQQGGAGAWPRPRPVRLHLWRDAGGKSHDEGAQHHL